MKIPTFGSAAGLIGLLATLGACTDFSTPTTYAAMSTGVGFGDYQQHLRTQEAARRSAVPYSIPPETPRAPAAAARPGPVAVGEPLPLPAAALPPSAPLPIQTAAAQTQTPNQTPNQTQSQTPAVPSEAGARPGGVADTTSFTPVPFGARPEGAEVAPTGTTQIVHVAEVPVGQSSGPNVMAYALQTRHSVGTQMYRRNNPLRWSRWERNCLQFASQDLAQEAFLAAGGPERDPNHLDPDGDGFACWWDPEPLRRVARIAPTQQGGAED